MFIKISFILTTLLIVFIIAIHKKIRKKFRRILLLFFLLLLFLWFNILITMVINHFNSKYTINYNIEELNLMVKNKEEIKNVQNKLLESKKHELNNAPIIDFEKREEYEKKHKTISKDLEINQVKLEKIQNDLDKLKQEYQRLYSSSSHMLKNIPTYHQYPNYPNGCESVALYLLLKYHNVDVSVEEIVNILPKGSAPFYKNDVLYASDPENVFVGDPRLYTGYGVYQKPIIDVANKFKKGIIDITGKSLDEVLNLVKNDIPVQVWVSINIEDTYVCVSWIDEISNNKIDWLCDLHSLVIFGYDYANVIVSDPYTGKIEYYDKKQFEKMYNLFGKRAIYYEN